MAVRDDIKDVFEEVGVSYTILRDGTDVSGEYLVYEPNTQVTKPFIREYFLEANLPYDTTATAGSVLQFDVSSTPYLVMNLTPEHFENASIGQNAVLYKCNVSGELLRFSGESWDANYRKHHQWDTVSVGRSGEVFGLLTEKLFGTDLMQDEELGQIGVEAQVLYLPSSYGAKPLDRYQAVSGEFYKIEVVETRKFDHVDVCHVAEDTREY